MTSPRDAVAALVVIGFDLERAVGDAVEVVDGDHAVDCSQFIGELIEIEMLGRRLRRMRLRR